MRHLHFVCRRLPSAPAPVLNSRLPPTRCARPDASSQGHATAAPLFAPPDMLPCSCSKCSKNSRTPNRGHAGAAASSLESRGRLRAVHFSSRQYSRGMTRHVDDERRVVLRRWRVTIVILFEGNGLLLAVSFDRHCVCREVCVAEA